MKRLAAKTEKKGTVTGTVKKTKVQVSINAGECIWEIAERTEPTCVKNGKLIEKCKLHQDTRETSIPATGKHTYKWVTDKEPTATEAGSRHEECTVCGYVGATAPSIYAQQGKCRNHAAFSTLKTIKQPL